MSRSSRPSRAGPTLLQSVGGDLRGHRTSRSALGGALQDATCEDVIRLEGRHASSSVWAPGDGPLWFGGAIGPQFQLGRTYLHAGYVPTAFVNVDDSALVHGWELGVTLKFGS